MLEANPRLTPSQIKDILQRTATPLSSYYSHEVGAGMLNAHAAVLEAAFPQRRIGMWRSTLDRGQVRFVNDPLRHQGVHPLRRRVPDQGWSIVFTVPSAPGVVSSAARRT